MTAHVHDPAMHPVDEAVDTPAASRSAGGTPTRPRWLLPGLAAGVLVAGLVLAGVVSLSTALYAAMFGGMLLMHVGGHGMHGGYGGDGHGRHAGDGSSDGRVPSEPQRISPPDEPGSAGGEKGHGGPDEGRGIEAPQHDQRGSHGCH
jgi:hypothetical protein